MKVEPHHNQPGGQLRQDLKTETIPVTVPPIEAGQLLCFILAKLGLLHQREVQQFLSG